MSVMDANFSSPFEVKDMDHLILPDNSGNHAHSANGDGVIIFNLSCAEDATLIFEVEILALDQHEDSFYSQFDDGNIRVWNIETNQKWHWDNITMGDGAEREILKFSASAGGHTLKLYEREDGLSIRSIRLVTGHPQCGFVTSASCRNFLTFEITTQDCIG